MAVVASGVFMATLDASIVNVSLPTLVADLDAPFVAVQWVVLAYLLVIAGLLMPAGRAAEILGRRRLFLQGFVVFTLGSLLAGFAPNVWFLIAFRIVQAIGGAAMQAISPALALDVFPAHERGRALGIVLGAVSIGLVAGPMVGGAVLGALSWPFIFFINVPVGVAGVLLGLRVLPAGQPARGGQFDFIGSAGLIAGLVLLLFGLNQIQTSSAGAPQVVVSLALGAAVLGTALWRQHRVPNPTIDLRLFRIREFSAASLASFLAFSGVAAQVLLLPFYLENVRGLKVAQVGLVLATLPALMGLVGLAGGVLSDRFGPRIVATAGLVLFTGSLASLATLGGDSPTFAVVARLAVGGVGLGLFNSANGSSLMGAAPPQSRSQAGAVMALARNMSMASGQALWGTVWATIVLVQVGVAATAAAPLDTVDAFRTVFAAAAVLAAAAVVVSLIRGQSPYSAQDMRGSAAAHREG